MRGYVVQEKGRAGWQDVPVPEIGPYDALVRPTAVATCTTDVHLTDSLSLPNVNAESGLAIGGDVVGIIDNHGQHGGYSECIVLDARSVTPKPARADFPEAASFLMNALTVRTALDALALLPGPTLLVTGAAGAFGGCAVQLGAAECLHVRGCTEMRAGTGARSWSADNCRAAAHRRGGARR